VLGKENIYQLPEGLADIDDFKKLPLYPSPAELKHKYIIKCKTKRIFPKLIAASPQAQRNEFVESFTGHHRKSLHEQSLRKKTLIQSTPKPEDDLSSFDILVDEEVFG
jgi:hypothetical protein